MAKKNEGNGRSHKASYARDKKKGGYIIRVEGPHANRFAGRDVPVGRRDGTEDTEHLEELLWTGVDSETQQPVALYTFTARPKDEQAEEIPW